MDNWDNMLSLTHTLDKIYLTYIFLLKLSKCPNVNLVYLFIEKNHYWDKASDSQFANVFKTSVLF